MDADQLAQRNFLSRLIDKAHDLLFMNLTLRAVDPPDTVIFAICSQFSRVPGGEALPIRLARFAGYVVV